MAVSLEMAKNHLHVDFEEDNEYIALLIEGAEDFIRDSLNRPIRPEEMTIDTVWEPPKTIDVAVLLLIGHWYDNRSAVVVGSISSEMKLSISRLIGKYKLFSFGG